MRFFYPAILNSIILLTMHRSLHREIALDSACFVLTSLLAGNYFFVAAFVGFLALMSFFLMALVFEQTMNIAGNIVSCMFLLCVSGSNLLHC